MARPTKYKEEYCEKLIKFFSIEPYEDKEIDHYDKKGEGVVVWTDIKRMANKLPTFQKFAEKIGVATKTLDNWQEQHLEFLQAYTRAKDLQKYFLIENGLNGCYNPMFTIFVAKNITDMRDKKEIEVDTSDRLTTLIKKIYGKEDPIDETNRSPGTGPIETPQRFREEHR